MDALAAEIARKRKERDDEAGRASGGAPPGDGKRKWVKKGDLTKAKEALYLESEAKDAEERRKTLKANLERIAQMKADREAASGGTRDI